MRLAVKGEGLLPATVLVAFLLALGRWGSYLGLPEQNLFVTDVALVVTAVWHIARHADRFDLSRIRPLWPLGLLVAWAAVRFAIGGQYDLIALRDVAPYAYVVTALAAGFLVTTYLRTLVVIEAALLVHLAWVWLALLTPDWTDDLPLLGGKVRVLELRPDFDGACLAVLACLAGLEAMRASLDKRLRLVAAAVSVVSALTILQLGSRSGILALVVGVCLIAMTRLHILRYLKRPPVLVAVVVAVAAVAILLPHTYVFHRWTADPTQSDAGSGTIDARQRAWSAVIDDTAKNPTRLIIGSGFGADFLDRSGAAYQFEGFIEKGVRAPHNYVLNTFARLGLVGVGLFGLCVVMLGRAAFRRRRRPEQAPGWHRFSEFTVLLMGALGVASMVGVILESPFGAVPFWWAAGFLLVGTSLPATPKRDTADGSEPRSVPAAP